MQLIHCRTSSIVISLIIAIPAIEIKEVLQFFLFTCFVCDLTRILDIIETVFIKTLLRSQLVIPPCWVSEWSQALRVLYCISNHDVLDTLSITS